MKEKIKIYLEELVKKSFLLQYIVKLLSKHTAEYIGNNFNLFFSSEKIDKELTTLFPKGTARQQRASLDTLRGKFFENVLEILLNKVFIEDKDYCHIYVVHYGMLPEEHKKMIKGIGLQRVNCNVIKRPDIDLIIFSEKHKDRIILISVKGTARERIGQFLSNIFIFDPSVIKTKYQNKYFINSNLKYKMAFVCFDMAKQKDFSFADKKQLDKKKTQKQMEVYLIDDDTKIGYGVYVLNNLPKLHKVGNFSELVAKIKTFFNS